MSKYEKLMLGIQLHLLKEAKIQTAILKGESPAHAEVEYGKLSNYATVVQKAASEVGLIFIA